jgi:hypothetical protein
MQEFQDSVVQDPSLLGQRCHNASHGMGRTILQSLLLLQLARSQDGYKRLCSVSFEVDLKFKFEFIIKPTYQP